MGTTPTYGLRYQELGDAPDGAGLGENLATDVEAELVRVDATDADQESRIVALETMPAWQAIPLDAGFQTRAATGAVPQYRIVGNRAELRGHVELTTGGVIPSGDFAVLPAEARPTVTRYMVVAGSRTTSTDPISCRLDVGTDGIVLIQTANNSGTWFSLDGTNYALDA